MTESNDMTIGALTKQSYENSRDHGFWDEPETAETIPSKLALIMSEMAEALESYRDPASDQMVKVPAEVVAALVMQNSPHMSANEALAKLDSIWDKWQRKPKGFDIELADGLIRIFDLAGAKGIDLESAVRRKAEYNKGRPFKHERRV